MTAARIEATARQSGVSRASGSIAPGSAASLQRRQLSPVSSLARLRTRSTMARRALASEMRTNALLSSSPSRLRRNSTMELSAGFSREPVPACRCGSSAERRLLVEKLHRHAEHLRQIEQPAGADAVDALLVLLDLLEGEAELLAELLLAHAEQHAAEADPAADVHIDRIGPSRALLARPRSLDDTRVVSTLPPRSLSLHLRGYNW